MLSISQFTGKVYPDRSFSIGRIPREKKKTAERAYDRDYTQQFDSYCELHKTYRGLEINEISWLDGRIRDRAGFNKSPKSSQRSKKYGLKGLTPYGRRVVKNSAILLEKKYGISKLAFVTCTIPSYDSETIKIISKHWNEVVRRFFQKMKRNLEKRGLPLEIICCTEIQPKRFKKYGDICPHLHFVYVSRQNLGQRISNVTIAILTRYWKQSMTQVVEKFGTKEALEVSFKSAVDAKPIRKSVAAYLSKYMSKGGKTLEKLQEKGLTDHLPGQWWTASNLMKKMFRESIIRLDNNTCNFIFYNLGDCLADGWLTWCNMVEIEINNEYRTVGCVGVFSEEHYYYLRS